MLVNCRVCGNGIVDSAPACPFCGTAPGDEVQLRSALLEPNDAIGTLGSLAQKLLRSGQHMEAMGVVQMWMSADPAAAAPHAAIGELLLAMGRFAEALEALDQAIALGLDDAHVRHLRSECARRLPAPGSAAALAPELSLAAALGARVATMEAAGAAHERVEPAHVVLGILSLDKFEDATQDELGLPPKEVETLRREIEGVLRILRTLPATPAAIRQRIRDEMGPGTAAPDRSIGRSDACRRAYRRATELARGAPPSALDILAVFCSEPDAPVDRAFRHFGLDVLDVAETIRRCTALDGLLTTLRQQHRVELELSPEAEGFLVQSGEAARLILTPVAALVTSGKLARHPAWRIVYDEGGVYLLPAGPSGTR